MHPSEFKEQNIVFAENQDEYLSLPAHKANTPEGEVLSCWKMSFKERLYCLFTGKVWLMVMTFNKPLSPVYLTTVKRYVIKSPAERGPAG